MWLVGVVVRRYIDFLLLLIPIYSSCTVLFCISITTFVHKKKKNFFLVPVLFVMKFYVLKFFPHSINTYGRLRASHCSHMKGAHNVLYEEAHTNERFISCDGQSHQLYAFKGLGVDLDV